MKTDFKSGLMPIAMPLLRGLAIAVSGIVAFAGPVAAQSVTSDNADNEFTLRGSQNTTGENAANEQGRPRATGQSIADPNLRFDTGKAERTNIRAGVVEENAPARVEEEPFAAPGIPVGTLRLNFAVEQLIGFTSNRQRAPLGDSGAISTTRAEFQLQSQWQRHQLDITGDGEFERYFDDMIDPTPEVNLNASLRLDLIDGVTATASSYYGYTTETASSTNLVGGAINEPGVATYGGALEFARSGNKLGLSLRGSIDRSIYAHADIAGGGFVTQEDRNVTNYGLSARVGYQTSPVFTPFVEASTSWGIHDLRTDRNGEERDSNSLELRGGIAFDFSEKLNGEISIGYAQQTFTDPGLSALAGFVADAEINWSPQRDTSFTLAVGSDFNGSTNAGDSGAITYSASLAAVRRVRDNLEITAGLGLETTDFEGLGRRESTLTTQLGYEYWMSRYVSFTGEANYERFLVDGATGTYDEAQFLMGVRFQR